MHPTQKPARYRAPAQVKLTPGEIEAARLRLRADLREVDYPAVFGQLKAIIYLLAMEPVGPHAWELIREAQADIEAFTQIVDQRINRWDYDRDDAPADTTLGLGDVDGYALGRR